MHAINNADDLEDALSSLTGGSHVVLGFIRGQENLRSEITL